MKTTQCYWSLMSLLAGEGRRRKGEEGKGRGGDWAETLMTLQTGESRGRVEGNKLRRQRKKEERRRNE